MNILFITADQWRGDCLSAVGHPHLKTPNLDALAADGVCFKNHFGQATPCGPARASLYTGMYLQNHRSVLNGTPLDARHTNVALETRKVGYEPALFGYTDVSPDPRCNEIDNGYEGVLPGMDGVVHLSSHFKPWLDDLDKKGYDIPEGPKAAFTPQHDFPGAENKGPTFAPTIYKAEDSNTAFLVNEAIDYLSDRQDKPWFVHLSFLSPHPPFVVADPYHAMYNADDMDLPVRHETPEQEAEQHPWLKHYLYNQTGSGYTHGADSINNLELSDDDTRQIKATYYGMMSEVDAQVGRLIDHLKETGTYDDTLIIFTSDHGENLGDHWAYAKYTYFNSTFHIPLIVRDPSVQAEQSRGTMVDAFTESVDVMPTILDLIGVDIPFQCDGYSLLPFCRGEHPEGWRTEYHAEFDLRAPYEKLENTPMNLPMKHCTANIICDENYKYVHFTTLPALFFDLKKDPNEFVDLSNDPDYKALALEYAGKLLSWRMEHDDPALTDYQLSTSNIVKEGLRSR